MKLFLIGVTAAITIAVIGPVRAQVAATAAQIASTPAQAIPLPTAILTPDWPRGTPIGWGS